MICVCKYWSEDATDGVFPLCPPPPPPPSSKHTAKCVDGGGKPVEFRSKGFGGVYDPLTCSPIGGLNPKPVVGYDACTPGMIIRLYY